MAEGGAADVAIHGIWAVKLRVVEGVKSFQAHLDGFRLGELKVLLQGEIIIFDPWPGEESAAAVSCRAERRQAEK